MALIGVLMILMSGCNDVDLLGANRKTIGDGYFIERFDEGGTSFWVEKEGLDIQGGPFEGTVSLVGWNEIYILGKVTKHYRGDIDGWYAICRNDGIVIGPIQEKSILSNPEFKTIKLKNPADYWEN